MPSSDRLNQMLDQYNWSQYPDIRELMQLLNDVTHDEKASILKSLMTLNTAARRGHTEIIATVLSSVPHYQRLDVLLVEENSTPLHTAAFCGVSNCVETILTHLTPEQQLVTLTVRDKRGQTPADWASHSRQKKTERLLREYQQRAEQQRAEQKRAEQQIAKASKTVSDNNSEVSSLTKELQQTKLQLDNQAKDIQMLTSAVTGLDISNKNKDEILQKITEESRELKSTVQAMKEEIRKQNTEAAKYQTETEQQREQILQQQTVITKLQEKTTNLCDELTAAGRQCREDTASQKVDYETKLCENQEQITRQQTQIDLVMSTVTVRNLAISNLNDRNEVLGTTCTNLREDVDRIDETVGRIDDQFFPESNAVGRGAPHDGGDGVVVQVIEEQWTVPQPAANS